MKYIYLAAFLLSTPSFAQSKIECIGPEVGEAKYFYIYLHGATQLGGHRRNVKVLKEIAKKRKVRFALPTAEWECTSPQYKGNVCWSANKAEDKYFRPALRVIEDAAAACFRNKDHGLMGFSNGAVLATTLMRNCVRTGFTGLIAVGHAVNTYRTDRLGLKGCEPQLNMLIGRSDPYYSRAKKTYDVLKSRDANVTFEEFDGKHELKIEPLLQFFPL